MCTPEREMDAACREGLARNVPATRWYLHARTEQAPARKSESKERDEKTKREERRRHGSKDEV